VRGHVVVYGLDAGGEEVGDAELWVLACILVGNQRRL
jgi:hypothetical protein